MQIEMGRDRASHSKPHKLDRALLDPTSVYDAPEQVLRDERLSHHQKVEILHRWEYDARELAVAEDEGMIGGELANLQQVLQALRDLETGPD